MGPVSDIIDCWKFDFLEGILEVCYPLRLERKRSNVKRYSNYSDKKKTLFKLL